LGLLDRDQYSLILAAALLSITANPLMFRLIPATERFLQKFPLVWGYLDHHKVISHPPEEAIEGHVVIIGYGRVGHHIVDVLGKISVPRLVIDADSERIEELSRRGIPNLYGDASNSEVLTHARLEHARALVVAGPDESASELVVAAARDIAPELPIIARATTQDGIDRLAEFGAQDVIHPELEGGLEIMRHTLLALGFPLQEIIRYMDAVRHDHYDMQVNTAEEHRLLHDLIHASKSIEVIWLTLSPGHLFVGQTLASANLRARTGASVVAILRGGQLMANPKSMTVFQAGDRIGLIGDPEEIKAAEKVLAETESESDHIGFEWET
jgi:CPA2 family monovalent cation:H+ antiporter-2